MSAGPPGEDAQPDYAASLLARTDEVIEWVTAAFSVMAALHVRRDKAALFQRVQTPPGERSSRKQPGQAWR